MSDFSFKKENGLIINELLKFFRVREDLIQREMKNQTKYCRIRKKKVVSKPIKKIVKQKEESEGKYVENINIPKILKEKEIKKMEKKKLKKEKEEKKREEYRRIILEKVEEIKNENKKLNEIRENEKSMNEKQKLDSLYNTIKDKSSLFLNGKIDNYINKLKYILKVGEYLEKEISFDKNNKICNLILPGLAMNNKDNYIINFLGYFGSELYCHGIKTYIEVNPSNELIRDITFKIITSGLATQTIYNLYVETTINKNNFSKNIDNWVKLNEKIKSDISILYGINKDDIYFFNYEVNKLEVRMVILNSENSKIKDIENRFNYLGIRIIKNNLLEYIILSPNMFEINFCKNVNDWPKEKLIRGGEEYFPPYGYIGIALKILKKYSKYDKDNIWLGKEGDKEGEWAVAYHGIGKGNVFNKVLSILNDNLKQGPYQYYSDFKDVKNKGSNKNCLKGVYFAPDIKEAELYAKNINLGWSKKKFQFIIMSRVNPKSIRQPDRTPINWILNDNEDEIRPYRLLVKINESND